MSDSPDLIHDRWTQAQNDPLESDSSSQAPWITPARIHFVIAALIYFPFAWSVTRGTNSVPSFTWSWVYGIDEFKTICDSWAQLGVFFRDLRVPIPTPIVSLEILSYWLTGDFTLATTWLYQIVLIAAFFMPVIVFRRGAAGVWWTLAQSMVFLWGAAKIHPLNPQLYDLWVPLCFLIYLWLQRMAARGGGASSWRLMLCAGAGFFLSMAELARPFIFPMLIFLIPMSLIGLRELRWKGALCFLLPLIVFSGGWHAKLFIANDGQVLSTNNSGFNLRRSWRPVVPLPEAKVELHDGWKMYNNPEHIHVSNELKKKIFSFAIRHPFISAKHVSDRLCELFEPMTNDVIMPLQRGIAKPLPDNHPWLPVYILFVRLSGLLLLFYLVVSVKTVAMERDWRRLGSEEIILLLFTSLSALLLAAGESGEDYRFIISILPCLAAIRPAALHQPSPRMRRVLNGVTPALVILFLITCVAIRAEWDRTCGFLLEDQNAALTAQVHVSSAYGGASGGLNDGIVGGHPGDTRLEWISQGQGAGAWAELQWPEPQRIDRVLLYDRPNEEDQVLGGLLILDGTQTIPFGALMDTAEVPNEIWFPPRNVSMIRAEVTQVKPRSPNIGFAEIAAMRAQETPLFTAASRGQLPSASANLAPIANATASTTFSGYAPEGAIDGSIGGEPDHIEREWASAGESAGAWLRLDWREPVTANRVLLFDRPNDQDQVKHGYILLDGRIQIPFGELPDDASAGVEIRFAPRSIATLTVIIDEVKPGGPNTGLSEVAVYRE
ncbi:MAG: hypothetical protein GC154_09610 [bacterium]|nr:hypothetical protein [bacterium]